jgi:putative selenium metabolism protein SsnA
VIVLSRGTVVISLDPPRLARADVLVSDGRVVAVEEGGAGPDADRRDCAGTLVLPGNVCAHHHLYSALARGMPYSLAPPENFLQVLQRIWWRLDRALDGPATYLSGFAGAADAVLAGTTTIVDHHASPNAIEDSLDQLAAALDAVRVRSVLCYEVTDRDGPERATAGVEENRRFLKETGRWPLARGMVGAHASFTLSEETLGACVDAARDAGAGIHVHVAEDAADQRDSEARFGRRVVRRLAEAGAIDDRSLLAHCIHVDAEEVETLRSLGAAAVHNPRSNMNNAVGHAPVQAFDRLCLGTDGIGGDMFAESQAAFWRAREAGAPVGPDWALGRLAQSARFAGRALGEPLLGTLEPGAPADLAVLDYTPPTPLAEENLAGHWVFGLSARMVRDVMVGGEWSVLDRHLVRVDERELARRSVECADRLWRRMADIDAHPFEPKGG